MHTLAREYSRLWQAAGRPSNRQIEEQSFSNVIAAKLITCMAESGQETSDQSMEVLKQQVTAVEIQGKNVNKHEGCEVTTCIQAL